MTRRILIGLAALGLAAPTSAQPLRTSDSLWFSTDPAGIPRLATTSLQGGVPRDLYLVLKVAPGPGYDVGGLYFPMFYGTPGESPIRIGASGSGRWSGSTGAVPGIPVDASYAAYPPFDTWDIRALYDRSHPALGDSSDVLVSFVQYAGPGGGWSGLAPIARLRLNSAAPGSYTVTAGRHRLSDGLRIGPHLTNAAGNRTWRPVVMPLVVTVDTAVVAVEPAEPVRTDFALLPVSPSPSSGKAVIGFTLPRAARVSLALLDAQGRLVRSILDHRPFEPGLHEERVTLSTPAGVYYCRMVVDGAAGRKPLFEAVRSLVVVR